MAGVAHGAPAALTGAEAKAFMAVLQQRFDSHMHRHPGVAWAAVRDRLQAGGGALRSLHAMERTGGEPDVLGVADADGAFLFCDCVVESPLERRSLCYDGEALASRKEHRPQGSAVDSARAMGATLLTEAQYRQLQEVEPLDGKTSSWLDTPADVRERGGALFGDRRYGRVFTYHNGAQSYYAARGFRAALKV